MGIWVIYIWAIVIFSLSAIHIYKAKLGFVGFIIILLCQLIFFYWITSGQSRGDSSSGKLIGIDIPVVIYLEGILTFSLFINSILEYGLKSYKYKELCIVLLLLICLILPLVMPLAALGFILAQ